MESGGQGVSEVGVRRGDENIRRDVGGGLPWLPAGRWGLDGG